MVAIAAYICTFLHPRWSLRDLSQTCVLARGWASSDCGYNTKADSIAHKVPTPKMSCTDLDNPEAHVCSLRPTSGNRVKDSGTLSQWSQILMTEKLATAHIDRMESWAKHCVGANLVSETESTGLRSGWVNGSLSFLVLLVFFTLLLCIAMICLHHFLTHLKFYLHIYYN